MKSYLIHVTDKVYRGTSSSNQKPFTLTDCFVQLEGSPYPEKLAVFNVTLPAGKYIVPLILSIQNGRMKADFDFSKATVSESK